MKYLLPILIVTLFLLGFVNQAIEKKTFYVIDYEYAINNKKTLKLSQIASNVEYIQLETNNECLIKPEARYFFADSLIFVDNTDHILKFTNQGKFLKKIGRPGRGPGEIGSISDISIIPKKRQIVVQLLEKRSLIYFSFDGKVMKTESIPYRGTVKKMDDGKTLIWDRGPVKSSKLTFLLTNENGDSLSYVPNYKPVFNNFSISIAPSYSFFPESFYYFSKRLFLKDDYNDTVYYIGSNKIIPAYLIKMGKYKLPIELYPQNLRPENMDIFTKKAPNYYLCNPLETTNQVFVTSHSYSKEVPKLILFDKAIGKGNLLINKQGISTGFLNDWDNGSDFWPVGRVTSNKVFMPLNIMKIQNILETNIKNQQYTKDPDKQRQLENIIKGLDILNNPIIMIVTLK